ncbi:MAG: DNA translocase FtsK 4TM domain-containing protein [Collinsella sp.]|nr:DNA translocase FtsK 4TM domain-containing protein [Collinsella sp.]
MARSAGQQKKGTQGKGPAKGSKGGREAGRNLRANEARGAREVPVEPLLEADASRDIAGVLIAVVAVASLIAVVSPTSAPVTSAVAGFYHLGFGFGAYVLPLVMLAIAAMLFLRERAPITARGCLGAVLIFVSVLCLLSLMVPGTSVTTAAMFEPAHLSSSGGYVGAFVASALQNALGKTISIVVAVGMVVLGMVVLGFSISDFLRGAADRAGELARRRRIDVNESPWGGAAAAPAQEAPARHAQPALFDDAPAPETTFLGDRETTVLPSRAVAPDPGDVDEDPFVDVSDQVSAESAKTRLIPLEDRYVDPILSDDEPDVEEEGTPQAPEPMAPVAEPPIPAFLRKERPARTDSEPAAPKADELPWEPPAQPAETERDDSHEETRELPPVSMLRHSPRSRTGSYSEKELEQTAAALQSTLQEFGLHSRVVGWISGPTVTTFKVQPGEGERVSRISSLEDDIALSLATDSVRIFAPIPGTSLVGIEIPNRSRQNVAFGDILPYVKGGPLEFALGRDAEGTPMVADLAKMPHLLIAGTTGSGKSVVISSILMSLLMRTFPEDVRLIMIDPKRVEFAPYDGLPHLYVPVVTEPKQAASALQWAVSEMERRLKIFERIGVRKISTFNEKQAAGAFDHYDNPPTKMPYLVIVIDELSDLMMVAGKDVEASIVRIAQLGRAAGIHMIVATQRPSSNVVTGLIKANITNRIGLTVATGIDSRVILDQTGAEKLLGQGDMLFSRVDWGKPKRIQGCYVSDEEIVDVVGFVKEQSVADYHEEILSAVAPAAMGGQGAGSSSEPSEDDPLLWEAARIVVESQLGSTSGLQRRLKVGYARAGRIMDMLEEKGVVGPPDGSKPREVLLDVEALAELESLESRMAHEDEFGGY